MGILDTFSLRNHVVVVTGATGVLGKAFVDALAEAGAKIAVLGRNTEKLQERVEAIEAKGAEALAIQVDVLNEENVIRAKDEILARWGTINGLVNAAGGNIPGATIQPDQNLFDHDVKDTLKAIELNLYGTIIPTHIFGRVIAESGKGSIINISSLAASRPITRVLGYTVAKHGVDGYTKWMSVELALRYGDKVRVNAIAPGVFLTEQNRNLLMDSNGAYSDRAQKFINGMPFQRLGKPDELKGTLVYLLSDASALVTGETIFVDGGFNSWCGV
ncbi:SDR family oxidoreductase [Sphingobacterium faecium]|uniref:SDR family oxidoreductase n=1 Tax=Sphingobacterium faecium TaxID=34087 RepID=UPI0032093902